MKQQLISIFIALSFTIVGSILSFIFPDLITIKDSIYIGIFSYIVSVLAFIASRLRAVDSIERIDKNMTYVSNYLLSEEKALRGGSDSFSVFWALCMLRAQRGIYKLIDSNTFAVEREQVPSFWQQAIINADISWFCTNYVDSPSDWESGWVKRGFELQRMGIEQIGTSVKRLFIPNDESKITENFINRMKWQQSLGVMVKWIPRNRELKWAPFKGFEDLIGTIDIAIINGSYLIAFKLFESQNGRGISSLVCYADIRIVSEVNTLFTRLWDDAYEPDFVEGSKSYG